MLMRKDLGSKRRRDYNGRLKSYKLGKRFLVFFLFYIVELYVFNSWICCREDKRKVMREKNIKEFGRR